MLKTLGRFLIELGFLITIGLLPKPVYHHITRLEPASSNILGKATNHDAFPIHIDMSHDIDSVNNVAGAVVAVKLKMNNHSVSPEHTHDTSSDTAQQGTADAATPQAAGGHSNLITRYIDLYDDILDAVEKSDVAKAESILSPFLNYLNSGDGSKFHTSAVDTRTITAHIWRLTQLS